MAQNKSNQSSQETLQDKKKKRKKEKDQQQKDLLNMLGTGTARNAGEAIKRRKQLLNDL